MAWEEVFSCLKTKLLMLSYRKRLICSCHTFLTSPSLAPEPWKLQLHTLAYNTYTLGEREWNFFWTTDTMNIFQRRLYFMHYSYLVGFLCVICCLKWLCSLSLSQTHMNVVISGIQDSPIMVVETVSWCGMLELFLFPMRSRSSLILLFFPISKGSSFSGLTCMNK